MPEDNTHLTRHLVEQARGGDRDAYDRLFALAADRALQFVRMRLGVQLREKTGSMDVLQDAYLEAHRTFGQFEYRGDDSFAHWLCRIIENRIRTAADYFGALKRTPPGATVAVKEVLGRVRASGTGVATRVERIESRRALESAIERMEEEERQVLLMRYYQDRTFDDIASVLGRSATSVRRILARATMKLGERLERLGSSSS